MSELARDLMVQESIIADLRKHSCEEENVVEPDLMANDPTRTLVRQMIGAVANTEKSQIVLKLCGAPMRSGLWKAAAKAQAVWILRGRGGGIGTLENAKGRRSGL
jgi:hypothetical protein